MATDPMLAFRDIKKSYGDNVVLAGVNFEVQPGEIVALVGENGAGKSTLMNILFGMDVIQETGGFEGRVMVAGQEVSITSPQDAIKYGIGMVHQEFMLIPGFTVMQNIKLNCEPVKKNLISRLIGKSFDTIDKDAMRRDAEKALKRVGIDVEPEDRVAMLPVGLKQFVEICREVDKSGIRLMVFDEPTAVLTETEAEKLLECLRSFAAEGISVIFISHRLDEVMSVSDRVVILRDGVMVINEKTDNLTKQQVAEMMVGRALEADFVSNADRQIRDDDIMMEFRDVSVDMPGEKLKHANLKVRRGEILGIGGLAGHGKIAVANAVAGMYPSTGTVLFNGEKLNVNRIGEALSKDIAFVSEDRKGVGLLLDQSITSNVTFPSMVQKNKYLKKIGVLKLFDTKAAKADTAAMIDRLEIRCMSPDDLVGSLSGGNQQKVCLAGVLLTRPKLLFVSEPTRGIDIGAKKLILNHLKKINAEEGVTIVMTSSELNELRSVCDRIVIVSGGYVQGTLAPNASNIEFALMMSGDPSVQQEGGIAAHE